MKEGAHIPFGVSLPKIREAQDTRVESTKGEIDIMKTPEERRATQGE